MRTALVVLVACTAISFAAVIVASKIHGAIPWLVFGAMFPAISAASVMLVDRRDV